jgi:hypothetical protein
MAFFSCAESIGIRKHHRNTLFSSDALGFNGVRKLKKIKEG